LDISEDGIYAILGSACNIRLFNIKNHKLVYQKPASAWCVKYYGEYIIASGYGTFELRDSNSLILKSTIKLIGTEDDFPNYSITDSHIEMNNVWMDEFGLFSDNIHILIGGINSNVYLYNIETGILEYVFRGNTARISNISVSSDNKLFVSSTEYENILWDLETKTPIKIKSVDTEIKQSNAVYIPETDKLLIMFEDRIEVYDNLFNVVDINYYGHDKLSLEGYCGKLSFVRDSKMLLYYSWKEIYIYDFENKCFIYRVADKEHIESAYFDLKNKMLYYVSHDKEFIKYNLNKSLDVWRYKHYPYIMGANFSNVKGLKDEIQKDIDVNGAIITY
jgi:WD40 repeat protein